MKNELKPVVCIVNPDDKHNISRQPDSHCLEYCITPYEIAKLKEEGVIFPDDKLIEGMILMKKPGNSKEYYYRTADDEYRLITERISNIELILSYLGAYQSNLHEETSQKNVKSLTTDVKVEGEGKAGLTPTPINVESETKVSTEKDANNHIEIDSSVKWKGAYTRESYEKAKEIARDSGLEQDEVIRNLIEMRDPSHPNPIDEKIYSFNLRSDFKNNCSVAADVKATFDGLLSANINVNVEVNSQLEKMEYGDIKVAFGKLEEKQLSVTSNAEGNTGEPIKPENPKIYIYLIAAIVLGFVAAIVGALFLL